MLKINTYFWAVYTWTNFRGYNALIDKVDATISKDSLVVVGFPCNNFGLQEPGRNEELLNGYRYVRPGGGFVPKFSITQKVDVNGNKEHPLFTFLKVGRPLSLSLMVYGT